MSTVGNGTTGASGTGPASGYNLMLSHLFIVFFLFLYKLNTNTSNPYTVIILLIFTHSMICFIIFGIKICRKIAKTLPECRSHCNTMLLQIQPPSITLNSVQTICKHATNSDAVKKREAQNEKEFSERTMYIDLRAQITSKKKNPRIL
jgi:hypothetical protein